MLIFNPLQKLQKILCENYLPKSDRNMGFFTFITVCKSFQPVTFWLNFLTFFQRISNSASNFALYDTHIEFLQQNIVCLYKKILLTVKPKVDVTTQKNEKRI
jgi:hypothetical protein